MIKNIIYISFLLICATSCDFFKQSSNISTYKIAKSNNQKFNNSSNNLKNISFDWDAPESWNKGKSSPMRIASFTIPYSDGNADLSIIQLNSDGGGVVKNVNRWREQLNLSKLSLEKIQSLAILGNSKIGTYKMYEIINPQDFSQAFLCTMISFNDNMIFIKLNSTINGIKEIKNDFIEFCNSFSPKSM